MDKTRFPCGIDDVHGAVDNTVWRRSSYHVPVSIGQQLWIKVILLCMLQDSVQARSCSCQRSCQIKQYLLLRESVKNGQSVQYNTLNNLLSKTVVLTAAIPMSASLVE